MVWMQGRMWALGSPLELRRDGNSVRLVGGASRIERSPAGDRGLLALPDATWVLLGDLRATQRGLVGRFASPPGGAVVRELVAMLLVADGDPILEAFDGAPGPAILDGWSARAPSTEPRILPRLVRGEPPIVVRALDEAGDETTAELAAHAIGEDLSLVYAEDAPDHLRRLTVEEARQREPDDDARLGRALSNLASLPLIRVVGDGPVFSVRRSGEHEAAFLLLPSLWEVLDPLLDGPRLVAIPRHDVLLVTGDAGEERRARLRALAGESMTGGGPVLSRDLHRHDGEVWRLVR